MKLRQANLDEYVARTTPAEELVRQLLVGRRRPVIFDIGACEGEDSIKYARRFPHSRVYAFEPLPENQALARANLAKYGVTNVELVPRALADRAGTAPFHVSAGEPPEKFSGSDWNYGNKSSSLLAPATPQPMHGWITFPEEIAVDCTTLDAFCAERGIHHIDFVHMDVQGAEHLVLDGAARILPAIQALWLEVTELELYRGQKLRRDLQPWLESKGFVMVYDERRGVEGDQFYVNRRLPRGMAYLSTWRCRNGWRRLRRMTQKAGRQLAVARDCLAGFDDDYGRARAKPSYAQCGEDVIAWRLLAECGIHRPRFVDIGAHAPFSDSNTALFHRLGCRGMNIEPDPELFAALRRARPHDINLNIGAGPAAGTLTFFRMADARLNTFVRSEAERLAGSENIPIVGRLELPVRPLRDVLHEHGFRPDFLSIDVEGLELAILQAYDFETHRPAVICAETLHFAGGRNQPLIDFIVKQGFRIAADTTINTLFVDARRSRARTPPPGR